MFASKEFSTTERWPLLRTKRPGCGCPMPRADRPLGLEKAAAGVKRPVTERAKVIRRRALWWSQSVVTCGIAAKIFLVIEERFL